MIYEPSDDSYLLLSCLKDYTRGKRVLDMGAGSGILSKGALARGAKEVTSVDIDEGSLDQMKKKGLNVLRSDLFKKVKGEYDLIIFNPPYLPQDKKEDKESARATTGGKKGDEIILKFIKQSKVHLEKEGIILLLLSSLTPRILIDKELKRSGYSKKVIAAKSLFMESLEVLEIRRL